MKTMMRKITTLLIVTVFACVGLVGCGAMSIDEVKGDWTTDTINGQSLEDYAAGLGLDVNMVYSNWNIKDDKTIDVTNAAGSGTLKMELKSDGFEATEEASGMKMSVDYNKDAGTLTYKVDANGTVNTCVMKRGTFTPTAVEEPAQAEDESQAEGTGEGEGEGEGDFIEGDDGSYDDGSGEGYDDEGFDEDYGTEGEEEGYEEENQ